VRSISLQQEELIMMKDYMWPDPDDETRLSNRLRRDADMEDAAEAFDGKPARIPLTVCVSVAIAMAISLAGVILWAVR
jgi:hypothetical protein